MRRLMLLECGEGRQPWEVRALIYDEEEDEEWDAQD